MLATGVGMLVAGLASDQLWLVALLCGGGGVIGWRALVSLMPAGMTRARRGVPATVAARLCVGIGFFGADTYIPLAANRLHASSTLVGGLVITGASLTWTLGAAWSARLAGRTAAASVVRRGFVILTIGVALALPVVWSSVSLAFTFVAWAIAGLGIGLVFNTTASTTMAATAVGSEGLASSQLQIADALGFALVGGTGGALVALADRSALTLSSGLAIEILIALAAAIVGLAISGRIDERRPVESVRRR